MPRSLGRAVDVDIPVSYRLPPVSLLEPEPAQAAAPDRSGDSVAVPDEHRGESPHSEPQLERASLPDSGTAPAFPHKSASAKVLSFSPTTTQLTTQLLPAVQRAYGLAQRGALFAAQTEFVQVLRRVAQAKDAAGNCDEHGRALAEGLRALDEAADFIPTGTQLEADLDLEMVASSHRTPVLQNYPNEVLPFQAAALYLDFAQEQLGRAVAGEQAGSMALHGLGKIYARLAERHDDDIHFAQRATAMYSAALGACPQNHLAANELGVVLCRSGHSAEAAKLFERSIDVVPTALAYHNLAVVQQQLGLPGQAAANEQESQRLAAWERATGSVSRRVGVEWVSPTEIARVAQPAPLTQAAYEPSVGPQQRPPRTASLATPETSPWQRVVNLGSSLPIPGRSASQERP